MKAFILTADSVDEKLKTDPGKFFLNTGGNAAFVLALHSSAVLSAAQFSFWTKKAVAIGSFSKG
jgi:hypothetical protein